MSTPSTPKRILVVRLDRIGDVVLTTPAVHRLRQAFPSAWIAMLVRPPCHELLDGHPDLDEVLVYDKDGRHHSPWSTVRFAWALRRRRFCAPCEQALCRFHHECMRFLTADEVYEAARNVLEDGTTVHTRDYGPERI